MALESRSFYFGPCVWCCVCFCLCDFEAFLRRFRRLLIFHVDSPLREKGGPAAVWVNGHDGSLSKLDKFHKNAPIAPKFPSADLPMIQLSACYVWVNSKSDHHPPPPPPPRANPRAFHFFKNAWSNSPLYGPISRSNVPRVGAEKSKLSQFIWYWRENC